MFKSGQTSAAWFVLFAAFTGCRKNELLQFRLDAAPGQPGYIEGDTLHLKRSKRGINPHVFINPDLRRLIDAHRSMTIGDWYFPGAIGSKPIHERTANHGLILACEKLGITPAITPHGLRAYYVTKRRSDGIMDAQIAAEIGDVTASLMSTTYGDPPPNWRGGKALSWMPDGDPAWVW